MISTSPITLTSPPMRITRVHRYEAPIFALLDWAWLKGPASIAYAALSQMLHTDVKLIVVVSFLVVIDFFTGIMAARRRGQAVRSIGLRQTAVKVVEYAALLVVFTSLANTYSILSWMQEASYVYVCLTEAKSIVENLYGPEANVWRRVSRMRRLIDGEEKETEVITNEPDHQPPNHHG